MKFTFFFSVLCLSMTLSTVQLQGDEYKHWDRKGLQEYNKGLWHRKKWRMDAQGAEFSNKVETIVVSYQSSQAVQLSQARKLVVPEIKEAIAILTHRQSARTIKKNGPFTIANLGFDVTFIPNGYLPQPYISLIHLINGKLLYKVRNAENNGFVLLHEESFEDALRIIEEESQHHNTTSEC